MLMPATVSIVALAVWVLVFTLKHMLGDFVFQNRWMVVGKNDPVHWPQPLLAHAAVHGALTAAILLAAAPAYAWLGLVDFVVHAVIDFGKSRTSKAMQLTPGDRYFYWLFGADQALHHLTGVAFAIMLSIR